MSVSLHPSNSLGFKRPLTQVVKRNLTITNHNGQPVAFKVKTTAPKLYCVRPNSGRVDPGESVEVSVMLQALPEEPPMNAKCKDKFLIQSTLITAEKETMPLQAMWLSNDTNEESKVHQQKLRVTYLPADGQTLEEEDETETKPSNLAGDRYATVRQHNGHSEPPALGVGLPQESQDARPFTPTGEMSRENSNEDSAPEGAIEYKNAPQHPTVSPPRPPAPELAPETIPVYEPAPVPPVSVSLPPVQEATRPPTEPIHVPVHVVPPAPAPAQAPAPARASAPVIITKPDPALQAQLLAANVEIEHLRATIASMSEAPPTDLRRRMRTLSDAGSTAETEVTTVIDDSRYRHYRHQQQEGVPLQVVVIIALGVFITTYLFF